MLVEEWLMVDIRKSNAVFVEEREFQSVTTMTFCT